MPHGFLEVATYFDYNVQLQLDKQHLIEQEAQDLFWTNFTNSLAQMEPKVKPQKTSTKHKKLAQKQKKAQISSTELLSR